MILAVCACSWLVLAVRDYFGLLVNDFGYLRALVACPGCPGLFVDCLLAISVVCVLAVLDYFELFGRDFGF